MELKTLLPLIGVVLGWVLGQGATLWRDYRRMRTLKMSLLEELNDISNQLNILSLSYARKLQIFALDGIESDTHIEISNYFFSHYYKELFPKFNKEQRMSYQIIHESIAVLNTMIKEFRNETNECYRATKLNPDPKPGNRAN